MHKHQNPNIYKFKITNPINIDIKNSERAGETDAKNTSLERIGKIMGKQNKRHHTKQRNKN